MTLRRQSIYHPAQNVSFTDDGPAVKVAFVDAARAWVKERSRAH
jgi:hypothetical protein